ncbi:MAG: hypothetical protein Q7V12_04100, partial [Deltaproteobacteria bacterium]|nr:hypothetical protein [Deltaproteobacteria bacterium]
MVGYGKGVWARNSGIGRQTADVCLTDRLAEQLVSFHVPHTRKYRLHQRPLNHRRYVKLQGRSKMSKRDIGQEILEAIRDIKAYKAGEKTL